MRMYRPNVRRGSCCLHVQAAARGVGMETTSIWSAPAVVAWKLDVTCWAVRSLLRERTEWHDSGKFCHGQVCVCVCVCGVWPSVLLASCLCEFLRSKTRTPRVETTCARPSATQCQRPKRFQEFREVRFMVSVHNVVQIPLSFVKIGLLIVETASKGVNKFLPLRYTFLDRFRCNLV
jgi:hypothetical protein